jgi:hypothetical protein
VLDITVTMDIMGLPTGEGFTRIIITGIMPQITTTIAMTITVIIMESGGQVLVYQDIAEEEILGLLA